MLPCTFEPGKEGKFVLKTSHGKLKRISMWNLAEWKGEWKGGSAGGCKNHKTFKENPQFTFRLDGENESQATGVVFQTEQGEDFSKLGFYVFKTERDQIVKVVKEADMVTKAVFDDDEEVSHEFETALQPGSYSFIPTTFEPGKESPFTVYLFTSEPIYDYQNPPPPSEEELAELRKEKAPKAGLSADELSDKWKSEIDAHKETIAKLAELQEQLRTTKESNIALKDEVESLRKGAGYIGGGSTSSGSASSSSSSAAAPVPTGPRVDTTEAQTGNHVTVFGSWKGSSAGGCMNETTWRNNPQLLLHVPSNGTKATFTFVQEADKNGKYSQIGFYIIHGSVSQGKRVVWLDNGEEDIVSKPKFASGKQLKLEMTLPSTPAREPFVVIPCTYKSGEERDWTLSINADCSVTLSPKMENDWKIQSVSGEWTKESAGGCRNHGTFTDNPQYLLTIPQGNVEAQARILLFQREKEDFEPISAYVVKLPPSGPAGGKQPRLAKVDSENVVGKPSFNNPEETCIALPANLAGPARFAIIPCTFSPGQLSTFQMQVVSAKGVTLEELSDGTEVSVSGEWAGKTAAGCLNDPISFKNNLQYHLKLSADHTLQFKQTQSSDNSGALVSQGFYIFKTKNGKRKFKIGKDDLVAKSGFIKGKDLNFEQKISAGDYIVVPCTFDVGEQARYKLSVFSKESAENFLEICQLSALGNTHQEFSGSAEWTSDTAGGCLNTMQWINNPQFQFSTEKKCETVIFLSVPTLDTPEKIQAFSGIGFYVVPSDANSAVRLEMVPKDVLKKASFRRSNEVAVQLSLEAGSYNIIPATLKTGYTAPFTVTVFTDNLTSASFRNLSGSCISHRGEWTAANAGGNTSNMEKWLTNPRYYISTKKFVKLSVLLLQRPELSAAKGDKLDESTWKAIGFAVTKGDTDGNPSTSESTDLVAAAPFEAERDVVATFSLEPAIEPYVVIPSTHEAGQLGTFALNFIFDPALKDAVTISTTPPNISDADLQEQLQAEVLVGKLQKCVQATTSSAAELAHLITLAGLTALQPSSTQLTAITRKLQAFLNALKAPELYAKEAEAEAAAIAEDTSALLPPPPPPPGKVPSAPAAPKTTSKPTSSAATGTVEEGEVYDGASKGLKSAADRELAPKSYSSPQEEMLALIAQGRAQLKNAADRKLKDKPEKKDSLLCAFSNSFDLITARRRAVEGEDEESDDDDDWD